MARNNDPLTPLLALLRALTPEQRDEFAAAAGTPVSYLYQLAGCHRGACGSLKAKAVADASVKLAKKYDTPVITMDVLATMCPAKARS